MAERGGAVIGRLLRLRARKPPYLAKCEYWVYLPEERLPPQEVLMARMLRNSPFAVDNVSPVGPSEGLLFSDIRLHLGLVLRSRNPHLFRPDLLEEHVVPSPELLEALSNAQALVTARFVSEEPLIDNRHLQFMPYLVEALAYYGKGLAVFDRVSEHLFGVENLRRDLAEDAFAGRPDLHLRTIWIKTNLGGKGATRGLVKIGLPELETPESPPEHETVIRAVLGEAATMLWFDRCLSSSVKVPYFGDEFEVQIETAPRGPLAARILRIAAS